MGDGAARSCPPPDDAGRAPREQRARACRLLVPKFSIPSSFNGRAGKRTIAVPRGCPHIGAGAGRYSACSVRLPFPGEWRSAQVVIATSLERFASRRAQAWPSGSRLRRRKDPEPYACGRRANHSIVGLQRLRPHGERRTGAKEKTVARSTRSCGAQLSSQERRCINELESTGSPVGLQACYKLLGESLPANSMQFEGKSEKVWLMWGPGGLATGSRGDAEASAT